MTKFRLALLLFLITTSIVSVAYFMPDQRMNTDPSKDAALNAWIARNEHDPEYQRLLRLDRTPGTGGILVDEKEMLPPLLPPGAAALNSLGPVIVRDGAGKAAIVAPTDWELQHRVRREIERARLEEPWLFDCATAPCR